MCRYLETQGTSQSAQSRSGRMLGSDLTFLGSEQERVLWKRGQEEMMGVGGSRVWGRRYGAVVEMGRQGVNRQG